MIRALIVDDEKLAREGIRMMLAKESDVDIVGESPDGTSAMRMITRLSPDLLFLDVRVPGLDGFEILERLQQASVPLVIFTTAYDKYAVKAFEARAVDYLLKPISPARLRDAVQRARSELERDSPLPGPTSLSVNPAPAATPHHHPPTLGRLVVKDRDRYLLLKASDVDWIQSAANYVQLHARGRSYMLRVTMNDLEHQLRGLNFARIHRSTIVNVDRLSEIRPSPHGDFHVILDNGTSLRLSRAYRDHLLPR